MRYVLPSWGGGGGLSKFQKLQKFHSKITINTSLCPWLHRRDGSIGKLHHQHIGREINREVLRRQLMFIPIRSPYLLNTPYPCIQGWSNATHAESRNSNLCYIQHCCFSLNAWKQSYTRALYVQQSRRLPNLILIRFVWFGWILILDHPYSPVLYRQLAMWMCRWRQLDRSNPNV